MKELSYDEHLLREIVNGLSVEMNNGCVMVVVR